MMAKTILDVSRWQGSIDWDAVKASGKIDGVMLRALGYKGGKPYVDQTFERNYAACAARGIPVGVYFWLGSTVAGGMVDLTAMLRSVLEGKTFQLPIAIDVEDPKLKALTPTELSALVRLYAAEIERWGLYAMVYTYSNFADTALDIDALAAYDLWIADYRGRRPTRRHGMWQYTSTASVPGITGNADLSHAYKDYAAIIAKKGLDRLREGA
jgi:GH25 family lysozyme M1 (1,4-beta-N-acetylmuramidase)